MLTAMCVDEGQDETLLVRSRQLRGPSQDFEVAEQIGSQEEASRRSQPRSQSPKRLPGKKKPTTSQSPTTRSRRRSSFVRMVYAFDTQAQVINQTNGNFQNRHDFFFFL